MNIKTKSLLIFSFSHIWFFSTSSTTFAASISETDSHTAEWFQAVAADDVGKMRDMLSKGIVDVNAINGRRHTALMEAIIPKPPKQKVFEFLIDHPDIDLNFQPDAKDGYGHNALSCAVVNGRVFLALQLLCKDGVKVNIKCNDAMVADGVNDKGYMGIADHVRFSALLYGDLYKNMLLPLIEEKEKEEIKGIYKSKCIEAASLMNVCSIHMKLDAKVAFKKRVIKILEGHKSKSSKKEDVLEELRHKSLSEAYNSLGVIIVENDPYGAIQMFESALEHSQKSDNKGNSSIRKNLQTARELKDIMDKENRRREKDSDCTIL